MKRKSSYERFSPGVDGEINWLARIITDRLSQPDKRRSPRKSVPIEVTLGQCLTCFGKWPIRNLSLDGAFLEGSLDGIAVGTLLDVAFRYAPKGAPIMRYVPARVVRVEAEGVAIRFGRYGQVVYTDLMALLHPM